MEAGQSQESLGRSVPVSALVEFFNEISAELAAEYQAVQLVIATRERQGEARDTILRDPDVILSLVGSSKALEVLRSVQAFVETHGTNWNADPGQESAA